MNGTTTHVNFRMEASLKKETERVFEELGMNLTTGFTVLAKAIVRAGGIPFDLRIDPFEAAPMQAELARRIAEKDSGRSKARQVVKTMEELEASLHG